MRFALKEIFGADRTFWHGEDGLVQDMLRERPDDVDAYDLIGGHFGRPILARAVKTRPVITLSVLRRPNEQIVSHFEFVQARPELRLHSDLTFLESLDPESDFGKASNALQCRLLTGVVKGDQAFKALQTFDHMVAELDRIDTLVARIAEVRGAAAVPQLKRMNVQSSGYQERHRTPETQEALRKISRQDRRLFRHLKEMGGYSERLTTLDPAQAADGAAGF